jgi:hypothetical protein
MVTKQICEHGTFVILKVSGVITAPIFLHAR